MKNISRRKFLQISALAAGATMLPLPLKWLGSNSASASAQSLPLLKKDASAFRGLAFSGPVLGVIPASAFYANDPNGIPVLSGAPDPYFANTMKYDITVTEFTDTLHPKMGATTLWGYHDTNNPTAKKHLGGIIIAARGTAARLRFTNTLPASHIIPVDTTVPGSNQAHNRTATHLHGGYIPWTSDGGPFDWFTPTATSTLRGTGVAGLSFQNGKGGFMDTLTGNTMLPGQADYYYTNDQSTRLMWYHDHAYGITRINAYAGIATGYLCLDLKNQEADFMSPAVAGIVGITAADVPTVSTKAGQMPQLTELIPLVFQDKIFVNATTKTSDPTWATVVPLKAQGDGSLWYAHTYDRALYRLKRGRGYLLPPNPSCVPEFFGDTMLCNGTVAPVVPVQARRFRFMLLNACNARFLNINMLQVDPGCEVVTDTATGLPKGQYDYVNNAAVNKLPAVGPNIIQIGSEGGYLQQPVVFPATPPTPATGNIVPFNALTFVGNLIIGNAERVDCIIDFSGYPVGTEFVFYSDSPGPFPGGAPTNDYFAGNIATPAAVAGSTVDTRNILRFKVVAGGAADPQPAANSIVLPAMDPPKLATGVGGATPLTVPAGTFVRDLTLNEDFDPYGRLRQLLGTTRTGLVGRGFGLEYIVPATEIIAQGTTEVWRIFNITADTHPIHFHLQTCQIVSRQPFQLVNGIFTPPGVPRGPEANEMGWKETVRMNPGEVTSVIFKWDQSAVPFDVPFSDRPMGPALAPLIAQANEFVWHCHILEHEEHDMMRPLVITGKNPQRPNVLPTGGLLPQAQKLFTVTLASTSTGFTVIPSGAAPAPIGYSAASFTVDFTGKPGTYTYTVKDSTNLLTSSITVTVA
ncbi:MAG: multicopper oxidase domain-containing protein [Verrucomicrobia bacterium]|nr:multicopper oxidase domain-containing protein [Deltaproteobacteria bacterium]